MLVSKSKECGDFTPSRIHVAVLAHISRLLHSTLDTGQSDHIRRTTAAWD
jgi:hypothetical protein